MERLIKDFTIEELKALAYDNLMQIEQSQANLKALYQEIRTRNTPVLQEFINPKE